MRHAMRGLFLAVLLATLTATVTAQSESATVSGSITDSSGAVVTGARVVITNADTNATADTATNNYGIYNFTNIHPGRYRLSVVKDGFRPVNLLDVVVHVQDSISQNFVLQIGSASESITVTGGAPLVNTQDASIGTVIDRNFVANLPLNGRSFQSLLMLNPGVVPISSPNGPGEFSVNGQRTNTNYFTVDGVSANSGIASNGTPRLGFFQSAGGSLPGNTALGTTSSLVPVDALEEFRVQTSTYSAEFGRQPGGQVQLVTRSGGNQFHGSAFEFLRNDVLDAQDWFNSQLKSQNPSFHKPALRVNDFGGTFSGPVFKDKTFFFFSYEGQRLRVPTSTSLLAYVPTVQLRQAASPMMQQFLNAFPLPNGPEVQVLEYFYKPYDPNPSSPTYNPLVPSGFATLSGGFSNPSSVDTYSLRLDQKVGNRLTIFGRYSQTPSNSLVRVPSINTPVGATSKNQTATIGTNFVITPRITNEFRANYARSSGIASDLLDSSGGATPIGVAQITAPYQGPGPQLGAFSIMASSWLPGNSQTYYNVGDVADNRQRQWNVVDNLAWTRGRHSLRAGVDWRHLAPIFGPTAYDAYVTIEIPSENPYSQLLDDIKAGANAAVNLSSNRQVNPIYDDVSLYVDDTWKISSRLTLTAGLRWEINPAPHDANGLTPIMITGISGTDTSGATLAPAGTPFYNTDYKAFAPRIGAAYQLSQTSGRETVLRGGFGVFYDLGSELALSGFQTYPFQSTTTLTDVPLPLSPSQAQQPPFPADPSSVTLPLHHGALWAFNPKLTLPYTLQWNVGLEQALGKYQLVTLSYVASGGRRLTSIYNLNNIPSAAILVGNANQYRANPNFDNIFYGANTSTSDYDSFQAQYQRRLSHGLQALANYTWSHAIDDLSYAYAGIGGFFARGNSDFDVRHNFSLALSYDLPNAHGASRALPARLVSAITGGWSIDDIFLTHTGVPLDVIAAGETLANGMNATIRPNVVPGQPVWIPDPGAPGGQQLNVNAFTFPAYTVVHTRPSCSFAFCYTNVYQQGNLARNTIRVPGIYQLNMGVRRQFSLSERIKFQANIEAFNIFNHPMFGTYNSRWSATSKTFGLPSQMLSTAYGGSAGVGSTSLNSLFQNGGPRSLQLSLKLNF